MTFYQYPAIFLVLDKRVIKETDVEHATCPPPGIRIFKQYHEKIRNYAANLQSLHHSENDDPSGAPVDLRPVPVIPGAAAPNSSGHSAYRGGVLKGQSERYPAFRYY